MPQQIPNASLLLREACVFFGESSRRDSGNLGEAADEVGVIVEARKLAGFSDRCAGRQVAFGRRYALIDNVRAYRKSGMLPEQPAYIFAAVMKLMLQLL